MHKTLFQRRFPIVARQIKLLGRFSPELWHKPSKAPCCSRPFPLRSNACRLCSGAPAIQRCRLAPNIAACNIIMRWKATFSAFGRRITHEGFKAFQVECNSLNLPWNWAVRELLLLGKHLEICVCMDILSSHSE